MFSLAGKTALVTGAARGIGLAIARAFATQGAFVFLTDIRDEEGQAAAESLGGKGEYLRLDVRLEEDWRRVVAHVLDMRGRLDVLVNNAGITGFEESAAPQDPEHASLESWRSVMAANLEGTFLGCKHGLAAMRRTGEGSIINISSRSGVVGIPGAAAYAASKAAVRHHAKTVALYAAEQGMRVRCNSIQPAAILTPLWDPVLGEGPERERRIAEHAAGAPLNRFGTPEEVAALAVYLAADESAFTTGAEFNLDGGMLAGAGEPPRRATDAR